MLTVYGIKNCDTVKRARQRLDAEGIAYRFHDFKTEGLDAARARAWIDAAGLDRVLNRRGTTWRGLDDAQRQRAEGGDAAALLAEQPSLVRRPVIEFPGGLQVGFARGEEAAIIARLRSVAG